jgi:hypothetical protein
MLWILNVPDEFEDVSCVQLLSRCLLWPALAPRKHLGRWIDQLCHQSAAQFRFKIQLRDSQQKWGAKYDQQVAGARTSAQNCNSHWQAAADCNSLRPRCHIWLSMAGSALQCWHTSLYVSPDDRSRDAPSRRHPGAKRPAHSLGLRPLRSKRRARLAKVLCWMSVVEKSGPLGPGELSTRTCAVVL